MIITVAYTRPLVSGYQCVGLRYCESVLLISPLLLRECSYHRYRAFPASAQTTIPESSGDLQETGPTDTFLYFVSRHHTNHQNCNHDYLSAYDSASTDSKRIHHFLLLVVLRVPVWTSRHHLGWWWAVGGRVATTGMGWRRLLCGSRLLVGLALGLHRGVHLVDGRLEGAGRVLVVIGLAVLDAVGLVDRLLQVVVGGVVRHLPIW